MPLHGLGRGRGLHKERYHIRQLKPQDVEFASAGERLTGEWLYGEKLGLFRLLTARICAPVLPLAAPTKQLWPDCPNESAQFLYHLITARCLIASALEWHCQVDSDGLRLRWIVSAYVALGSPLLALLFYHLNDRAAFG